MSELFEVVIVCVIELSRLNPVRPLERLIDTRLEQSETLFTEFRIPSLS